MPPVSKNYWYYDVPAAPWVAGTPGEITESRAAAQGTRND